MISIVQYNPNLKLDQYERAIILASYRFHRGNRVMTAQSLGITTKTLYNKLKSYLDQNKDLGIDIGGPEEEDDENVTEVKRAGRPKKLG